jgi:hypothetical protein
MMVGVLDSRGLLRLFRELEGRRLLGVVDADGVIELVFTDAGPRSRNLVTFYCDAGRYTGLVAFGSVSGPVEYAEECRRWGRAA